MLTGCRIYQLKKQGLTLNEIAAAYDMKRGTVGKYYYNYRAANDMPKLPQSPPKRYSRKKITVEKYGAKWHKMHCGKGMKASDIAKKENIMPDQVRVILREYRQKKWGGG